MTIEKTPMPTIRHSKELHVAIEKARANYGEIQEKMEDGRWYIWDGKIVRGEGDTQWEAWMEAAYGPSRSD